MQDSISVQTEPLLMEYKCIQTDQIEVHIQQTQTTFPSQIKVNSKAKSKICICYMQIILIIMMAMIVFLIKQDLDARFKTHKSNEIFKSKFCQDQYDLNKCHRKLPAQQTYCAELENCIYRQFDHQPATQIGNLFGEITNNYFEQLTLRSFIFLFIMLFTFLIILPCICFK